MYVTDRLRMCRDLIGGKVTFQSQSDFPTIHSLQVLNIIGRVCVCVLTTASLTETKTLAVRVP